MLLVNASVGHLGWNVLAGLFWYPPLKWLADLGYRVVANNRSRFAPWLFRGEEPAEPAKSADDPPSATPEA